MSYTIDPALFFKHHHKLLDMWKSEEHSFNNNFDAFVISNGKEDSLKPITSSLNVWYFGYDLIDTLLAFTKKSIIFIGSSKKLKMLESFKQTTEFKEHNVNFIEKDPKDNSENIKKLIQIMKNDADSNSIKIGQLVNEKQIGALDDDYTRLVKEDGSFEIVECSNFVSEVFLIKDSQEMGTIQKASRLSKYFFQRLTQEFERCVEEEDNLKHSQISEKIFVLLDKQSEQNKLQAKYNVDCNVVDFAYSPNIQSGGEYNLESDSPNDQQLKYDTIINRVGMTYNQYNSHMARTYFIDPSQEQKDTYNALWEVHQKLIKEWVKPGQKLNEVYEKAVEMLKEKLPNLPEDKIPTQFGNGIGLFFSEKLISVSKDCNREIKPGMVFNIYIKINGLSAGNKNYAIYVSDTLILTSKEVIAITTEISSKLDDVSYALNEDNDEESEDHGERSKDTGDKKHNQTGITTRTRNNRTLIIDTQAFNQRKNHQTDLRKKKAEEMKERLMNDGFSQNKKKERQIELEKMQSYKAASEMPDLPKNLIHVDQKRNCLLLPINGQLVPININIVKNCNKQDEGNKTFSMRLNFHYPGSGVGSQNIKFPILPNQSVYIKELTFRSKNENRLNDTIKKIKELQKKVKTQQQERSNQDEMVEQDPISYIKGKRPVLKDLKIRPPISNKKSSGMLECHNNGFRYVTQRHEHCEITFKNIKHAFFQPCDQEMIIVLHFHLFSPVMLNKKKTYDVQFYTEAAVATVDLNQRRGFGYDEDYEDEEQEKLKRKKLNRDFKAFVKASEEIGGDEISFDKPFREFGFDGAPQRATVFLQPTINCLINVVDSPQFILTLEEVELCCFERMISGLKNFDLVFVFKDYDRPIQRITAIPMNKAEEIKNWLDKMDIIFFESTRALVWTTILGEIKKDIEGFVEDGGWDPVLDESDNEGEQESEQEGDSNFDLESEEEEDLEIDESDFSGSGSGSLVSESEEDNYSESGESLSEEGLSWDELAKQAQQEDHEIAKRKREERIVPPKKVQKGRR